MVIAIVLIASSGFSLKVERVEHDAALAEQAFEYHETPPPPSEW